MFAGASPSRPLFRSLGRFSLLIPFWALSSGFLRVARQPTGASDNRTSGPPEQVTDRLLKHPFRTCCIVGTVHFARNLY
jgi:hypothetical protein